MSEQKIVMQQLQSGGAYTELWPKTDCYTKEETNQLIQSELPSVDWQIGDVRTTVKTDLTDDWHLCDGSVINSSNYLQLTEYLGDNGPYITTEQLYTGTIMNTTANYRIYYNNIYAFVENSNYYLNVWYGNDLTKQLTKVQVGGLSTSYVVQDLKIQVNNGVFGISCKHEKYIYSWYSTDLITWTKGPTITTQTSGKYASYVLNGNWVFIDRYTIYSSSDSIPSSWTQYSGNTSYSYLGINYFDSKYWLLYATNVDYTALHYASFTDIANPLGGGYTTYDCAISFSSYMKSGYEGSGNLFKKNDGYYLLYSIPNSNGFYSNCFSFSENLVSNPFSVDKSLSNSGSFQIDFSNVKEVGQGIWVPVQVGTFNYGSNIIGNQKQNSITEDIYSGYWKNIDNSVLYVKYTNTTGSANICQLNYVNSTCKLPSITVDTAKAYIKVK